MTSWSNYRHIEDETEVKEISGGVYKLRPQTFDLKSRNFRPTTSYTRSSENRLYETNQNPMADTQRPEWSSRETFDFASTSTDLPHAMFNGFTRTDEDQHVPRTAKSNKTFPKRCLSGTKMLVVFICVAFGTAGVVYLIINFRKEPPQEGRTDKQVEETDDKTEYMYTCNLKSETAKFKEPLEIACKFKNQVDYQNNTYTVGINFTSDYSYLHDNNSYIEANIRKPHTNVGMWDIRAEGDVINLTRSTVQCDSGGTYDIYFSINGTAYDVVTVNVEVQSETSQVSLDVGRQSNTSDLYDIACSVRSECSPVPLLLLGKIDDKSVPLFGSDFQCIITFSNEDGWSANCTGTMPQRILESFSDILCTTRTGNDSEDARQETKLNTKNFLCKTDDCVFDCPAEDGDKFYLDPTDCSVFHRCVDRRLYTRPCGRGTYFNTKTCACDHKGTVEGCNDAGQRPQGAYEIKERCDR